QCDDNTSESLMAIWILKVGESDPSTYEFGWDTSGRDSVSTITRFSCSEDVENIINAVSSAHASTQASSGNIVLPSVTTDLPDALILRFAGQNQGSNRTRTAPASHAERYSLNSGDSNSYNWQGLATIEQAVAGASGTATWASASTRRGGAVTI